MQNGTFCHSVKSSAVGLLNSTPDQQLIPSLTDIIDALQAFQPSVRAAAIALYASEIGISQMHFYAIALHANLGGKR